MSSQPDSAAKIFPFVCVRVFLFSLGDPSLSQAGIAFMLTNSSVILWTVFNMEPKSSCLRLNSEGDQNVEVLDLSISELYMTLGGRARCVLLPRNEMNIIKPDIRLTFMSVGAIMVIYMSVPQLVP